MVGLLNKSEFLEEITDDPDEKAESEQSITQEEA